MSKRPHIRNLTKEECFASPLTTIHHDWDWGRYKGFMLMTDSNGEGWVPHHNVYSQLWTAVRWGLYFWRTDKNLKNRFDHPRFVLDLYTGQIVWQNFDKTKLETYKYKGIGDNYESY